MSEMKRLVFGEGLMVPSLDGSKRFTVRKYREGSHDFSKDEVVVGEFKDGLNILLRITDDTKKAPFKKLKITRKQQEKEGYYFNEEYFEDLKAYQTVGFSFVYKQCYNNLISNSRIFGNRPQITFRITNGGGNFFHPSLK